ncbi:RNA exonuclease [Stagonosporopsis vannaccii]|nr:RNA exonuclease [Stagonosporopsis vannaccii]
MGVGLRRITRLWNTTSGVKASNVAIRDGTNKLRVYKSVMYNRAVFLQYEFRHKPRFFPSKAQTTVRSPTRLPGHLLIYAVADDKSQITTVLHRYGAVLASQSIPEVLSIYTSDGVIMAPGHAPAAGRDALKAAYERIFSTIKLEIEFSINEIVVTGDGWAFARTTAEGTKYWLKRGTDEEHRNQELFVLKKEGEWRIARYAFSSMRPLGRHCSKHFSSLERPWKHIAQPTIRARRMPADMTKRKRSSNEDELVDVGLGATLAHLRGEAPIDATPKAEDDEGWTVAGGSKRRRKERADSNNSRGSRRGSNGVQDPKPDNAQPVTNPFAPHGEQLGDRASPPKNPFSTSKEAVNGPPKDISLTREERRKERKLERNYPSIEHSHHARLQSHVKISDLQALVLYLLAEGNAPQWVSVRNRTSIRQVVMLMVPGLELGMFNGKVLLDAAADMDVDTAVADEKPADTTDVSQDVAATEKEKPKYMRIADNDFYPASLKPNRLPTALRPLSDIFDHIWPIKAHGEHRGNQFIRVHSPIHTMLTSQIPKSREEKQMKKNGGHKGPMPQNSKHWDNKRTQITEYIATLADQQENEYVLHPAWFLTTESKAAALKQRQEAGQSVADGWVDTNVASLQDGDVPDNEIEQGSVTAGRHIISVDCEMCKAENDQLVLTRISLLNWDGTVAMDKLVKPDIPIKDYLTQWSGITPAMLENVTTTLSDIQKELLKLITPRTILVGHSLNSDLNAMKLTHPFIIDTGILFPHPRGPPYKQSLKWLAQKYLHREVQKGSSGHDSVEDSKTCLDLVKQKCEKGPKWGSGDTNAESIFKRLGRTPRPKSSETRMGAVIDWGEPQRGHGGQAQLSKGCKTDDEVVDAIDSAMKGSLEAKDGATSKVDFVWARLRELELARGWWDDAKTADVELIRQNALQRLGLLKGGEDEVEVNGPELGNAVSRTVNHITQIYDSLPRCTAFVVYSGTGDPREVRRLQAMQQQYRREYATKNWDNLSVKWTDTEVQALSKACQDARNGIGFIVVK